MEERMIKQSQGGELTLTDARVVFDASKSGRSSYTSIPLDQVAHCALTTKENPIVLFGSVLSALAALSAWGYEKKEVAVVMALACVVLFVFYQLSKAKKLVIASSAGGEIAVKATVARGQLIEFIQDIEEQRRLFEEAKRR